jgi:hypothetical protein
MLGYADTLAPARYHGNLVTMATRRTYSVAEDRALARLQADRVVGYSEISWSEKPAFQALERHGWARFTRWSTGCGWVLVQGVR